MLETAGGAEVSQDEADVPGARRAYRSTIEAAGVEPGASTCCARRPHTSRSPPAGTRPTEVDADAVIGSLPVAEPE